MSCAIGGGRQVGGELEHLAGDVPATGSLMWDFFVYDAWRQSYVVTGGPNAVVNETWLSALVCDCVDLLLPPLIFKNYVVHVLHICYLLSIVIGRC